VKDSGNKAIGETLKSSMDDPEGYAEALVGIYKQYDNLIKKALNVLSFCCLPLPLPLPTPMALSHKYREITSFWKPSRRD
jgi:hypothetical protein